MSVSVCLSARISQNDTSKLHEIFCTSYTRGRMSRSSSDDNAACSVLPVLWMTSCLPTYGPCGAC